MAKIKIKNCKNCGRVAAENINSVNHILHIILTFLTGGLWFVIYLLLLTKKGKYVCKRCGRII